MDWDKALRKLPSRAAPAAERSTRAPVETFQFEEFDDATQAYLRQARDTRGRNMPGVFAPKTNYLPIIGLVLGFVLVIVGLVATLPPGINDAPINTAMMQMAFLLPGAWMIIAAFRVWSGASKSIGHFVYCDARRLFDCDGTTIKVIELDSLREADGTHNYNEGKYQNTAITLRLENGKDAVTIHAEEPGRQLIVFLNCITWLNGGEMKNLPPLVLGGLACEVARTGQMPTEFNESVLAVTQIPEPLRTGSARSGMVGYLLIIAAAVGGVFVMIPINKELRDDNVFQDIRREEPRDLRAYLHDDTLVKHRAEVEQMLAVHYQGPLNTLRAAAQKSDIATGPLEIIEALKTARYPAVSIHVREQVDSKQAGGLFSDSNREERRKAVQKRITEGFTRLHGAKAPDLIIFAELQTDEIKPMIDISYKFVPDKERPKEYMVELTATFRKGPDDPEIISRTLPPVRAGSSPNELKSAVEATANQLLNNAGIPTNT